MDLFVHGPLHVWSESPRTRCEVLRSCEAEETRENRPDGTISPGQPTTWGRVTETVTNDSVSVREKEEDGRRVIKRKLTLDRQS